MVVTVLSLGAVRLVWYSVSWLSVLDNHERLYHTSLTAPSESTVATIIQCVVRPLMVVRVGQP